MKLGSNVIICKFFQNVAFLGIENPKDKYELQKINLSNIKEVIKYSLEGEYPLDILMDDKYRIILTLNRILIISEQNNQFYLKRYIELKSNYGYRNLKCILVNYDLIYYDDSKMLTFESINDSTNTVKSSLGFEISIKTINSNGNVLGVLDKTTIYECGAISNVFRNWQYLKFKDNYNLLDFKYILNHKFVLYKKKTCGILKYNLINNRIGKQKLSGEPLSIQVYYKYLLIRFKNKFQIWDEDLKFITESNYSQIITSIDLKCYNDNWITTFEFIISFEDGSCIYDKTTKMSKNRVFIIWIGFIVVLLGYFLIKRLF
jgi:hypothetical protein